MLDVISHSSSITQRIHRSTTFTKRRRDAVANRGGPFAQTGNSGAAEHRFESRFKPLSHLAMTISAISQVAERASAERRGVTRGQGRGPLVVNGHRRAVSFVGLLSGRSS